MKAIIMDMSKDKSKKSEKHVRKSRKGTISGRMYAVAILPVILFALAITFAGIPFLSGVMRDSAKKELKDACISTQLIMNATYPGEYRLTGKDSLYFYKGNTDITSDYSVVDTVSQSTGLDISIIYKDTRILTTLRDDEGTRAVGTGIATQIYNNFFKESGAGSSETKDEVFYDNTIINGRTYYTYYMPLISGHGNVQGIVGAAKPSEDVEKTIRSYIFMLAGLTLVLGIIMVLIVIRITKPMTQSIDSIFKFVREASDGNETALLDENVLRRHDELGEIGESVLNMQRSMRNLMESDSLTKLFNRRSAHRKLGAIVNKAKTSPETFCVSIGDIDFFKHVNDTYGHDAGDEVLVRVADIIRDHMKNYGFVARWGGEEFLMVFDKTNLLMAENALWSLLDRIRAMEIRYENYIINVTMSYGVSEWNKEDSVDTLIKSADDKLYFAKNSGRNRVVSSLDKKQEDESGEIEKLLKSISSGDSEGSVLTDNNASDEVHFENLSATELEAILSGKADEEAEKSGDNVMSDTVSFSASSYTN